MNNLGLLDTYQKWLQVLAVKVREIPVCVHFFTNKMEIVKMHS